MNRDKIANMIRVVNNTQDSIKGTCDYFKMYTGRDAEEIAKIFQEELAKGAVSDVFAVICVIHEILEATASPTNVAFVRAFGNRAKSLFQEVANHAKDLHVLKTAMKIFEVWEKKQYYTRDFIEKLRVIMKQKIDRFIEEEKLKEIELRQQRSKENTTTAPQKYSKVFIRDYNATMENEISKSYYERKLLDQKYSKYEERLMEIAQKKDEIKADPDAFESTQEFLKSAKTDITNMIVMINDQILKIASVTQEETKNWLSYNLDRYDFYELQIKKRKNGES